MEQAQWVKALSAAAELECVVAEWAVIWPQDRQDYVYARNAVQKFRISKDCLVLQSAVLNAEPKWSEDNDRKTEDYDRCFQRR